MTITELREVGVTPMVKARRGCVALTCCRLRSKLHYHHCLDPNYDSALL